MATDTSNPKKRPTTGQSSGKHSAAGRSDSSEADARRMRAQRLLQQELAFIHSTEFEQSGADHAILGDDTETSNVPGRTLKAPKDVPAHLAQLWEVPLLAPVEEKNLFRRMNYLKYLGNTLRSRLNPRRPNVRTMDRIERMLGEAEDVRNYIVRANLRLVVSIVRRFANDRNSFDELVSDGNLILIRAAERFDYSRGFRFSTYATHSVQRDLFRKHKQRQTRKTTEALTSPEVLLESVVAPEGESPRAREARQVHQLTQLMEQKLRDRERRVMDLRYGLSSNKGGLTLREIGDELGLSKERVRQIQVRAIERIRQVAHEEQ